MNYRCEKNGVIDIDPLFLVDHYITCKACRGSFKEKQKILYAKKKIRESA